VDQVSTLLITYHPLDQQKGPSGRIGR